MFSGWVKKYLKMNQLTVVTVGKGPMEEGPKVPRIDEKLDEIVP